MQQLLLFLWFLWCKKIRTNKAFPNEVCLSLIHQRNYVSLAPPGDRGIVYIEFMRRFLRSQKPNTVSLCSSFICHTKPLKYVIQLTHFRVTPEKSHTIPTYFSFLLLLPTSSLLPLPPFWIPSFTPGPWVKPCPLFFFPALPHNTWPQKAIAQSAVLLMLLQFSTLAPTQVSPAGSKRTCSALSGSLFLDSLPQSAKEIRVSSISCLWGGP